MVQDVWFSTRKSRVRFSLAAQIRQVLIPKIGSSESRRRYKGVEYCFRPEDFLVKTMAVISTKMRKILKYFSITALVLISLIIIGTRIVFPLYNCATGESLHYDNNSLPSGVINCVRKQFACWLSGGEWSWTFTDFGHYYFCRHSCQGEGCL